MSLSARGSTWILYIDSLPAQLFLGLLPRDGLHGFALLAKAADLFGVLRILQKGQQFLPEAVIENDGFLVALRVDQKLRLLEYFAYAHRGLLPAQAGQRNL